MRLSHLTLDEFRIYRHLDLAFAPGGLRISGRNGSGKSSVIEAIAVASTARSPRSRTDRDLIRWNSGEDLGVPPFARLELALADATGPRSITIAIEQPMRDDAPKQKRFRLDGQARRAIDVVGVLKTVLFSPEDVQLIGGPPADRRRQVDMLLSQIDRGYLGALAQYGRVLQQRNGLLKSFARDRLDNRSARAVAEIGFWDSQLVEHGARLIAVRERLLARLAGHMIGKVTSLIDGVDLAIVYQPRLQVSVLAVDDLALPARMQQIHAMFTRELEERRHEEFRRGMTLVGPHRDDVAFTIDGRDLAAFGSRGQQRLAVIAYKLAETALIEAETGEHPVLMLDDVLSELDQVHRDMLLGSIAGHGNQIIVTSTDDLALHHPSLANIPEVTVAAGSIAGR